jgi:hypothetical protein
MYKDELKAMRDSLIKEIREMVVTALEPFSIGRVEFVNKVNCTTFQNSNQETSIYGVNVNYDEDDEVKISITVNVDKYPIKKINTDDLAAICDELKTAKFHITGFIDASKTVCPNIIYTVKENSAIDGDCSCSGVIGIYSTLENARTALKNRAERAHAEEEKRWSKYEDAYEWERTEEKYNIWKNGDYLNNHIHITIEETEVNPSFYLS